MAEEMTAASGADELAQFKEYLAEPRFRIKLDDAVNENLRTALERTGDGEFPPNATIRTGDEVAARFKAYEEALRPLLANAVLLGKWATAEQRATLANILVRMSDNCVKPLNGTTLCLSMRWYPLSLLSYAAGIASLAADNYDAFVVVHTKRIDTRVHRRGESAAPIMVPTIEAMLELSQGNIWKMLPGHERNHAPESEYLFKTLQPILEDLLFLGGSYDSLFDRYEIFRALIYADLTGGEWGPIGRFGWKHSSRMSDSSPYHGLRAEADAERERWGPIKAGLFRGSYARFEEVTAKYEKERLNKLNWL